MAAPPVERLRKLDRLQSVVGVAAAVVGLLGGVIGIIFIFFPDLKPESSATPGRTQESAYGSWLGTALTVVVVGLSVALVLYLAINRVFAWRRRTRRKIDLKIGAMELKLEGASSAQQEQVIETLLHTSEGSDESLWKQRVQRHAVEGSALRREVESRALDYLPLRPRSVKRVLNHMRLQLALVVAKNVLGGTPAIEAAHVAKWVVIGYRWPTLAAAAVRNPPLMGALEGAPDSATLDELLANARVEVTDREPLERLIAEAPQLGSVLERLVGLQAPA
jgi:hypothetical protein